MYVLLPLLPAFEGEIGTNTGTAVQAVVHWNYASICRGGRSLLERLAARGLSDCVSASMLMSLRDWLPEVCLTVSLPVC